MTFRYLTSPSSTRRRQMLGLVGVGMLGLLMPKLASAAPVWRQLEAAVRSIGDATVEASGLELTLPLVAEDGSSVPLTVASTGLKSGRIHRLEIFAPANPTPEVAVFEFGPEIKHLNLSMRIRLSESQSVIAVAHTEDGRAIVAERAVRVTVSGCVAPAKSDPAAEMNARVRVPKAWPNGQSGEVLTMISHPMITGLAADASGQTPPARIIESFQTTLNGQPVLKARYFRSLAANPYLKFELAPNQEGELQFEWVEDTGKTVEVSEKLRLA